MKKVKARSYTLRTENGQWLGQVVITDDGMFSAVTDWGNASYAWRSTGEEDFREFLMRINTEYFASKMVQGMSYIAHSKKLSDSYLRFALRILPVLQKELEKEISENEPFN